MPPRRRRRELSDPAGRKLYEAKIAKLREEQKAKDEEESRRRLEKRQREERQRELEEDRRRRQQLFVSSSGGSNNSDSRSNKDKDLEGNINKNKTTTSDDEREQGNGKKLSLNRQSSKNNKSGAAEESQASQSIHVSSPGSSVSMSQQSQSQLASQNSTLRRRLGSFDKDADSENERNRRYAGEKSAIAANIDSGNGAYNSNTAPSATVRKPVITAPKITYKRRAMVDSSSDSDSSDEEDRRRFSTKPAAKPFIGSTANKRTAAQLGSDSSSDGDDNRAKSRPMVASKRQKSDNDITLSVTETAKSSTQTTNLASPEKTRSKPDAQNIKNDDFMDNSPPPKAKQLVSSPTPSTASKQPIKASPLNPLAMQKREREEQKAFQQKQQNQPPRPLVDDSMLWDSDPDEVPIKVTTSKRRRGGAKTNTRAPPPLVKKPAPVLAAKDDSASQPPENLILGRREANSDEAQVDEELEIKKMKQHPNFANPHFGPFENIPLVLKNEEGDVLEGDRHQVPASLSRYLPNFQREGVQFVYNALANGRGAILGDDMGLGKTVQVISVLSAFLRKTGTGVDSLVLEERKKQVKEFKEKVATLEMDAMLGLGSFKPKEERIQLFRDNLNLPAYMPILLIVPSSVLDNWAYEFDLWGHFSVAMFRDSEREAALEAVLYGDAEVMVVGHKLFGMAAQFKKINAIPWKLCVVDEFHVFKSPKGHNSKNLKKLSQDHDCRVVGMTGTVMQNRFEELHNLVDLVDDKRLGTLKTFMKSIADPIKLSRTANASAEVEENGEKKRKELNMLLRPLYIQRKKTEVLKDMPLKVENVLLCPLSELQRKVYAHILNLPDYLLLRGANTPCDCGINKNYFAEYVRLRSAAEKIDYQRKNSFKKRSKCCYQTPPPGEEKAVLWHHQHFVKNGVNDEDNGDHDDGYLEACEKCPTCLLLPALNMLYKLSSSIALLQFNEADKSGEKKVRDKQEAFAKIAFPDDVIKKLPGSSYTRCDSALRNSDYFAMSGKMKKLHQLLLKIHKDKERVLLFSYSTKTLDVIQSYMDSQNHTFLRIDGSTPSKMRQGLVNEFQKSDNIFCFLLSTRAAGVGLNLTAANQVIIFDCEWNPANDEQAQDRSFRIGQKKDVTVHRLIAQGTIDELKYLRQIYKLHLKQETFRSAEGSEAAPRSFLGVEKDTTRKGELFGMENLLNFSRDASFMDKVWKANKKHRDSGDGLRGHSSEELAKDWGAIGETILQKEEQEMLIKQIEQCIPEEVKSGDHEVCDTKSDQEDDGEKEDAYNHNDFLQRDRVQTEYLEPENVMGGETQAVDDFVMLGTGLGDENQPNDPTENSSGINVKNASSSPPTTSEAPVFGAPGYETSSEEEDTDEDDTVVKSSGSPLTPRQALLQKARGVASWSKGKGNFALCGVSAKEIRNLKTEFSVFDIFQPKAKKDS